MSIDATYQRRCDRCKVALGEPESTEPKRGQPLLTLESPAFRDIREKPGIVVFYDLCDSCQKDMPGLIHAIITLPKKKPAKKKPAKKETAKKKG